jgi:hypothetical protein
MRNFHQCVCVDNELRCLETETGWVTEQHGVIVISTLTSSSEGPVFGSLHGGWAIVKDSVTSIKTNVLNHNQRFLPHPSAFCYTLLLNLCHLEDVIM